MISINIRTIPSSLLILLVLSSVTNFDCTITTSMHSCKHHHDHNCYHSHYKDDLVCSSQCEGEITTCVFQVCLHVANISCSLYTVCSWHFLYVWCHFLFAWQVYGVYNFDVFRLFFLFGGGGACVLCMTFFSCFGGLLCHLGCINFGSRVLITKHYIII